MKNRKIWVSLIVFATVFATVALAIFVLSLFDIRVFSTNSTTGLLTDVFFLISSLVLSSVIITVSIYLSRKQ